MKVGKLLRTSLEGEFPQALGETHVTVRSCYFLDDMQCLPRPRVSRTLPSAVWKYRDRYRARFGPAAQERDASLGDAETVCYAICGFRSIAVRLYASISLYELVVHGSCE